MSEPKRIQLSRAKGWRKPEGAIVVARPSRWGNPFRIVRGPGELGDVCSVWSHYSNGRPNRGARVEAVSRYRNWLNGVLAYEMRGCSVPASCTLQPVSFAFEGTSAGGVIPSEPRTARFASPLQNDPDWLAPLRGHDLACWCPLDQPCHADVLLELANA